MSAAVFPLDALRGARAALSSAPDAGPVDAVDSWYLQSSARAGAGMARGMALMLLVVQVRRRPFDSGRDAEAVLENYARAVTPADVLSLFDRVIAEEESQEVPSCAV